MRGEIGWIPPLITAGINVLLRRALMPGVVVRGFMSTSRVPTETCDAKMAYTPG
jgi:hypothetical protein